MTKRAEFPYGEFQWIIGLRFYVASSLANAVQVRKLSAALIAEGHIQTYDWTIHGSVFQENAMRADNIDVMGQTAVSEAEGVASAEVVIVLLPGGKGTHVELGMALAARKPVIIAADQDPYYGGQAHNGGRDFPCAFWFHPLVRHREINEVVKAVRELTIELRAKAFKAESTSIFDGLGLGSIGSMFADDPYNEAMR